MIFTEINYVRRNLFSHPHDGPSTLSASGSEVLFVISFTEELSLLLDETDPDQWTATLRVRAHKVIWTPLLVQCSHEWSSVLKITEDQFESKEQYIFDTQREKFIFSVLKDGLSIASESGKYYVLRIITFT